ncbi:MAG: extracellular solute-binding protein [Calditrichia bacterium]
MGVLLGLLVGCGGNGAATGGSSLLYWSANNPNEIAYAKLVVEQWNRRHPDQPLRFQPVPEGRSSEEIILAAVVGKTTPDIYSNMWQGDVEAYARAGKLVPLDTIPGFLEFMQNRCDSATLAEVTSVDGHIYQIPWKINPIMMVYNRGILREAGVSRPPRTYEEYYRAAEAVKADLDGDGYVDRWIGYSEVLLMWYQRFFDFYPLYLAASGGAPLVKDGKVAFNNSYAVEVFRFLQTLYRNNYFPRERLTARSDPFLGGVIVTRFTGPWEIQHAEKFKPAGFDYDFAPIPVPDTTAEIPYTYGDPKNIVIFNTCKNPRLAWEFLELFLSRENEARFLEMSSQLPRRKDLFTDTLFTAFFEKNPRLAPFARQAVHIRGTDVSPVLKEIFDIISQEYEACVIYGVKSPEQAVADAARAAQLLLD